MNIFGLLKESGIYFFGVPCNNWVDHGFFQFSPTFFRDLCIDNPGLELLQLDLATELKYYNYSTQSPAFLNVLLRSPHKLNVVGIIRKTHPQLILDLTQSKYRNLYSAKRGIDMAQQACLVTPDKFSIGILVRRVATGALRLFCSSNLVPLRLKEFTLNGLFRLRNRYSRGKG